MITPAAIGLLVFVVFGSGYVLGWMNRGDRVLRQHTSTIPDRIKFLTPTPKQ